MRNTGIPIVGTVPWGMHLCQFYENKQDLLDILVPYFKAGLENNEFCMWVTAEPLDAEEARAALAREVPRLCDYLRRGQIEILDYRDWYTAGGKFDSDRVLQGWVDRLETARGRGFDGLRLTGDTFWLEKPDWQSFTEYEAAVDAIIGQYPMLAICTYSVLKCAALEIRDVVANHGLALIKRGAQWQVAERTGKKETDASGLESETQFRTLADAIPQLCWIADADGWIFWYNRRWYEYTGATPAQMQGWGWQSVHDLEMLPQIMERWKVSLATGEPFDMVVPLRGADGVLRPFLTRVMPIRGRDGSILRWFGTNTDIGEQVKTEQALRESQERFRGLFEEYQALFNALLDGFCVGEVIFDAANRPVDFRFLDLNPAFEAQTGLTDARGRLMREVAPRHAADWLQICGQVALTGQPAHFEEEARASDRWHEVHAYRVGAPGSRKVAILFNDITARKQAEENRAHAVAARYARSLLEASLDPLVTISPEGRITDVNHATELVTGVPRAQLIGSRFSEYFLEPRQAEEGYRKVLAGGIVKDYPLTVRHISGRTTDVLFNATLYRDEAGQAQGVFAAARDITERKRAEEKLRAASLYARGLLEASPDPLVTINPEGQITDVNEATERVTGVPREQLIGSSFSGYFTEPGKADAGYHQVLADGMVRDYPLTIRHVDGHITHVMYNAVVYRNEAGEVQGVFAAARDVTPRIKLEEDLRAASLYARSLLEASLDPLVTISPEGKITDVNEATELVTGVRRHRLIGSDVSDYFTEPDRARAGYRQVLTEGLVRDYPLTIRHVAGHTTDVLYNAVLYRNEAGEVQGVFAAARDVTERKRAEAELARYRDQLEELVRQRTAELESANRHLQRTTADLARSNQELEQFAYVASHDLQEPLRAVTGYLGLLERQVGDKLDDNARHQIAGATQGAARMHSLINDLLALSRVGTWGRTFQTADLNGILDQALDGLRESFKETRARITRDPLPAVPVDAGQITQLFQNLIGNALKFRGEAAPEIHIGARRQPGEWVLSVRDNGIGIEPQYFERIFLIFQRLHTRSHYPGTGIGLAICKKIVERHGGRIWVESQAGRGSTFFFTISNEKSHGKSQDHESLPGPSD